MLMQAMRKRNEAEIDAPMIPPTDPTPAQGLELVDYLGLTVQAVIDVDTGMSVSLHCNRYQGGSRTHLIASATFTTMTIVEWPKENHRPNDP